MPVPATAMKWTRMAAECARKRAESKGISTCVVAQTSKLGSALSLSSSDCRLRGDHLCIGAKNTRGNTLGVVCITIAILLRGFDLHAESEARRLGADLNDVPIEGDSSPPG
jgi:hypothetical protein